MKIIPLSSVEVRRRQRTEVEPKPLFELVQSIRDVGLLHPPVMWQDGEKWVLSVGERRLNAIKYLNNQTLPTPLKFHCGDQTIGPGEIPITPLGDYLDEIGRFEAELHENVYREPLDWRDKAQALSDLHEMRAKSNPTQTLRATAAEVVAKSPTRNDVSRAATDISRARTIVEHLHDSNIAAARNSEEALALIYKKEEEKARTALIKRQLMAMDASVVPNLEVRHGDLLSILPVLDAKSFDLILADPPYGIDAGTGGFRARTIHHHNYSDDPDTARKIARAILTDGFTVAKDRANILMFCAIEYFEWLKDYSARIGWVPFNRPLIWQKSESEGLAPWGDRGPRITTEFIFYATKGERGFSTSPIDVFRVARVPRKERIHAAEKPVELLRALIECSTLPGEAVLDPCCGSGSTLVACREAKRTALGIEKDQTYYNTAMSNVHGGPDGQGTN